jgi:hypothetical protein
MTTTPAIESASAWPRLALDEWRETYATLHLWTQIVGKTRLALAPMQNHWWQVAFYITSQGFGTSPMPYGARTVEVDFDFIDHALVVRTSDGDVRSLPLVPQSVADFYRAYLDLLESIDVEVHINPMPAEIADAIRFTDDRVHAAYDRDATHRCWQVLAQADRVLKEFRGQFLGKCSPVHLWWGGFDLACTRFSGRRAPPHPGGIPHLSDAVTREAYSHECISAGWWPGGGLVPDAAFYAYSYPEPAGCADARIHPAGAYYHPEMREWLLPYEAVRTSADPDAAITEFLASTYQVAADLGHWDRRALER